jgi:ABC-type phosphate/phosphonate transport system substrate-binding protein
MENKQNSSLSRRDCLRLGAGLAAFGSGLAWAKVPDGKLRLTVNEVLTGDHNAYLLASKYEPLCQFLSRQLKEKSSPEVEVIVNLNDFVRRAASSAKPDLVFGKSVNQLAHLVREEGYVPLVKRPDPYEATFITSRNSGLKTLADVKGCKVCLPDENSATTALALAALRDVGVPRDQLRLTMTRFQEAVIQQVGSGFVDVGAVSPNLAQQWARDGGVVLARTRAVTNWSVLAAPHLNAAQVARLTETLVGMHETAEGAEILSLIGVKQWVKAERQEYYAMLDYIGR